MDWVKRALQEGFQICLVSNAKHDRLKLCRLLGIPAVGMALKPLAARSAWLFRLAPNQVAVIGDQLFTDVFGGNRLGLYTILINPLSTNELDTTKLMRRIERSLLEKMVKRGMISRKHAQIRQGESQMTERYVKAGCENPKYGSHRFGFVPEHVLGEEKRFAVSCHRISHYGRDELGPVDAADSIESIRAGIEWSTGVCLVVDLLDFDAGLPPERLD